MAALSSVVLGKSGSKSDSQSNLITLIRKTIRTEILAVGFQLLFGALLVATIVFALVQLGYAFQILSSQFENGLMMEFVTFGLIAVSGLAILYLMFNRNRNLTSAASTSAKSSMDGVDLSILIVKFTEGFIRGIETSSQKTELPPSASS